MLLLVFIGAITSSILPYSKISDDVSLYRSINAPINYVQFQDDTSAIVQWVKRNFLLLTRESAVQCSYPVSVSILTLLPSCMLVILS